MMDMEFEKIRDEFDKVVVNTTAAREHVGEIERVIKFIKERARCVVSDLRVAGFKYLHQLMLDSHGYYRITYVYHRQSIANIDDT